MKYIVMETFGADSVEEIFLFPNSVNHDCMAEVLSRIKNQTWGDWKRIGRMPVSAGFVNAEGTCYGESESLGLESRPSEDTELLRKTYHV